MVIGTGTIVAGMFCSAFGGITAAALIKAHQASHRKTLLTQIMNQLGDGEQICGEIVGANIGDETFGAMCSYDVEFLGIDGLTRKITMPMRLDMGNRFEVGTPMLLRMSPAPIEPLLLPLNAEQYQITSAPHITLLEHPTDATGRVLLESDYFALKDFLNKQKTLCGKAMVKYGVAAAIAGLDLFGLLVFFIYSLM